MDFAPPRGTLDFLPPEGDRLWALYERAARLAHSYGYRYVETPGFEHTELFRRTSGESSEVVSKEMYTFKDRGDRDLTLRAEGTAPVMRAFLHQRQEIGMPFKSFYLTRMYRYGRPQAGRYREHRQFGIEVMGVEGPGADAEVILVGDRYLRSLGLSRYHLELNSLGDPTCRPAYREELLAYLRAHRDELRDEHRDRFEQNPLRVLDCKDEACRKVAAGAPKMVDRLCDACRAHFEGVQAALTAAGLPFTIVPTMVRGLDYYTRTAFEFVSEVLSQAQGTLFGGGRYDGLAEALGGPRVPGVGYGMGLERVLLALGDEGLEPPAAAALDVFVVAVGAGHQVAQGVLAAVRAAGFAAESALEERPMGAQMRQADRAGARVAVVLGDREAEAGTVTWRRLADGAQSEGTIEDVIAWLRTEGASA